MLGDHAPKLPVLGCEASRLVSTVVSGTPRYRFAPSPTGYFHVGGARTALYNWILALQNDGVFVLRIEDTDESRNQPQWTQGIIDALAWVGINGDDPHFEGPYFQSANAAAHTAAAQKLHESGHAYYCDLTSEQIQERAKAVGKPGYDGYSRDRGLSGGPGRVLRFKVPAGITVVHDEVRGRVEFDNSTIEDFVLLRGNGSPVFIHANVVDDIQMGITNVVRAEEHLPNTPKQQMLWQALGHEPPVWAHVPVLVNEQRKKLSKRRDKVALEQYRAEGVVADAMVNYLMTLGWAPSGDTEIVDFARIVAEFRLASVNHSSAFFDVKKLNAFNGEYLRKMSSDEFVAACEPWLSGSAPSAPGVENSPSATPWPAERFDRSVFARIAPLVQTRVSLLSEVPAMIDFFFLADPAIDAAAFDKAFSAEWARPALRSIREQLVSVVWNVEAIKSVVELIGASLDVKLGKLQAPLRVATTGRSVGPPLFESLEVLGRDETLRRIDVALSRAG
ncbi:MAG: glutamate--tRNA ligase [Acidimicrobiia bacterium]|nr:glutamate--tRNA ligase [Acidimicrobiia bacterium]